jgi:wyosine [tRNA(Phe)-imidazoG37] synthetase (radical SAM superfamily)
MIGGHLFNLVKKINTTPPPPVEYQDVLNRNKELEADIAGLRNALDEKTRHWEEAVNRNREVETELVLLHKGNRGLMEELQFLKVKNKELSEMHDDVVLYKWQNINRKNVMCKNPFTRIEILENGDVYPCCSAWLKNGFSFGNVYNNDSFDEIWNSENAKKHRYSVTEGDFEYCNKYCYHKNFANNSSLIVSKNNGAYNFSNYHDCYLNTFPVEIALSCDTTCNLRCPSCRTHIKVNSEQENNKLSKMLNTIIRPALKNCSSLTLLGSGEFFTSKPLQDFCKALSKQEFPDLKINIHTNAQLLTKEKYREFDNLKGMIGRIAVSVDGAEKQTYETIRMGGKWERLLDALSFISDLKEKNNIEIFLLRFVVQKLNYKQIPAFVTMAKGYKADQVSFQRITNWGTFNATDFFDMDVMNPKNEHYEEAKRYIEEALKEQDIIVTQNCLGVSGDDMEDKES